MEETQRERHVRLDENLKHHLLESEKKFKFIEDKLAINDKAHEEIHLAVMEIAKQNELIMDMLAKYNWLARGVMMTLFFLGIFTNWFVTHGKQFLNWLMK